MVHFNKSSKGVLQNPHTHPHCCNEGSVKNLDSVELMLTTRVV